MRALPSTKTLQFSLNKVQISFMFLPSAFTHGTNPAFYFFRFASCSRLFPSLIFSLFFILSLSLFFVNLLTSIPYFSQSSNHFVSVASSPPIHARPSNIYAFLIDIVGFETYYNDGSSGGIVTVLSGRK